MVKSAHALREQDLHVESVTILLPQLREQDSHVAQKRFTFG